jgi:GNAT superfamily N-acetyltransferase
VTIGIRDARSDDRAFVVATARRLAAFGPPPWRSADEIVNREVEALEAYLRHPESGTALLVATAADGEPLGFVYLETVVDYFTHERQGHIGILAVSDRAEGSGAGRALMDAAERWARSSGFRTLTLNVFEGNRRARDVYEHLGYKAETLRYVKGIS